VLWHIGLLFKTRSQRFREIKSGDYLFLITLIHFINSSILLIYQSKFINIIINIIHFIDSFILLIILSISSINFRENDLSITEDFKWHNPV